MPLLSSLCSIATGNLFNNYSFYILLKHRVFKSSQKLHSWSPLKCEGSCSILWFLFCLYFWFCIALSPWSWMMIRIVTFVINWSCCVGMNFLGGMPWIAKVRSLFLLFLSLVLTDDLSQEEEDESPSISFHKLQNPPACQEGGCCLASIISHWTLNAFIS